MSLLARTSLVSAATLASRVLGFARDAATAAVLGVGPVADALAAAMALPLLARRLLAEGAFNLAFIPALARAGDDEAAPRRLAGATLLLLCGLLLLLAAAAALFIPQLIGLMAPGFEAGGQRADVAILCGRVVVLYVPLAGLAAIYGGIANATHRVLLPALAPAAANVTVLCVIAVLLARGLMESDTAAFAIVVAQVGAGAAQFVLMRLAARGCPALPLFRVLTVQDFRGALGVLRAASPALLFAGLSQLRFIVVVAAVSASPGAVAALNYAQRLLDLPLGLVGASAGAVLVPALLRRGRAEAADDAGRAVLAALAFALPAAVGLAVLAEPIVITLFQRGSFDAEDARLTGALLAVLAASLPAQGLERILSAAASTAGLITVAERIALASLVLCMAAAAALAWGLGPLAAAGAVALSSLASILALGGVLVRRGALRFSVPALLAAAGLAAASLAMGVAVHAFASAWPPAQGTLSGILRLTGLICCGAVIYGAGALGVKVAVSRAWRHGT
ncbi:murein biosynthesis integral membrane protein MurJ [Xanthobacter wiegelii]|uniref:murein biosynthesis integral membrane protein MurJ n=1 Tax=Xanthobacter wiegelii TaxID=3119913 RepID=UPI00372C26D6